MTKLIALISSYIVLWLRLLSPGGVRAIVSENIILRHQLITLSRGQKRAPRLTPGRDPGKKGSCLIFNLKK